MNLAIIQMNAKFGP